MHFLNDAAATANFDISDTVVLGIIGFVQILTLTLMGFLAKRGGDIRKDVSVTKENVVNHHQTNMRVEQDQYHQQNQRAFAWIGRHIVWLVNKADSNSNRIGELENTHPTTRKAAKAANFYDRDLVTFDDIPDHRMPWDKEEDIIHND